MGWAVCKAMLQGDRRQAEDHGQGLSRLQESGTGHGEAQGKCLDCICHAQVSQESLVLRQPLPEWLTHCPAE